MKVNQWTIGLASMGAVSLALVVNADEAKMNPLQTALSATTISGYVDTSINWNNLDQADRGRGTFPIPFNPISNPNSNGTKQNGFNLNVVKLSLEKAMDTSEWSSGYKIDLIFGPDAIGFNNSANSLLGGTSLGASEVTIQQAYVALRTPVGNGIDWKIGTFNCLVGYESYDKVSNPNFTHSYGYYMEPTEHTGILASYRFSDTFSVAGGVANVLATGINLRATDPAGQIVDNWDKEWMASFTITVPKDCGFLSGSTLTGSLENGFASSGTFANPGHNQRNYYIGGTMNTPVAGLKVGAAYDQVANLGGINDNSAWDLAGYVSYQATEKLSFHGRAEMGSDRNLTGAWDSTGREVEFYEFTGTIQYDLWANVMSRLEIRYDHSSDDGLAGHNDTTGIYANFIYKF